MLMLSLKLVSLLGDDILIDEVFRGKFAREKNVFLEFQSCTRHRSGYPLAGQARKALIIFAGFTRVCPRVFLRVPAKKNAQRLEGDTGIARPQ